MGRFCPYGPDKTLKGGLENMKPFSEVSFHEAQQFDIHMYQLY